MPIQVIIIYALYFAIGLLHCFFVGTVIAIWSRILKINFPFFIKLMLVFVVLFFLESYWIYVFNYLNLKVYSHDAQVNSYFHMDSLINIVDRLDGIWFKIINVLWQTLLAGVFIKKIEKYLLKNDR